MKTIDPCLATYLLNPLSFQESNLNDLIYRDYSIEKIIQSRRLFNPIIQEATN